MRNALTLVQLPQTAANSSDESNPLLNFVPRRIVGKLLKSLNGDLL